jgi:hypothetical protein
MTKGRDWEKTRWKDKNLRAQQEAVVHPIGTLEKCWCGEPFAHGWSGQEDGAPHPKKTK